MPNEGGGLEEASWEQMLTMYLIYQQEVDTHIGRLSNRLRLSKKTDPVKIEKELCGKLPQGRLRSLAPPARLDRYG